MHALRAVCLAEVPLVNTSNAARRSTFQLRESEASQRIYCSQLHTRTEKFVTNFSRQLVQITQRKPQSLNHCRVNPPQKLVQQLHKVDLFSTDNKCARLIRVPQFCYNFHSFVPSETKAAKLK